MSAGPERPALSVVIPTWNGLGLLQRFLPSVTAEAARMGAEVVVSDDGSEDDSRVWMARTAPAVRVIHSRRNRGFAPAANAGVAAARGAIVVLLNNDLELPAGALEPVPARFSAPGLFALTFRGLDFPGGELATAGKLGRFRRGFWETWRNFDAALDAGSAGPAGGESFMLVGGFCAFRREVFLELGGFDGVFAPYYSEDLDLSYRARKRGWRIEYEPRVPVLHVREASTSRHRSAFGREVVTERNRLLFHWRNLGPAWLARHLLWAHLLLVSNTLSGRWAYTAGYLQAVRRIPEVMRFRRREAAFWRAADGDLTVA